MSASYDLSNEPREKILEFARRMQLEFVYRECVLESFEIHKEVELKMGRSKCGVCKSPWEGHTLDECAAREYGDISHLYRPKPGLAQ